MSNNAVVELKGGMYTLMSLRLHSSDMQLIDAGLADKVQQAPGFFSETPVVLDLSEIETSADIDADELLAKVRQHKLVPVMASVSDKEAPLAKAINLPLIEASPRSKTDSAQGKRNVAKEENPSTTDKAAKSSLLQIAKNRQPKSAAVANSPTTGDAASNAQSAKEFDYIPPTPMLVTRPVRSGQQLYARDTDLIIMAHVGPGAEIVADNNVHVYGPLRGRALCGVTGNTQSRIFCQSLEAELVSVAGNYKVLEEIPEELRGKPAQIWLQEGRLHIEAL